MHRNADHYWMVAQTQALSALKEKGLSSSLQSCYSLTWAPPVAFLFSKSKVTEMREEQVDYSRQHNKQPTGRMLQAEGALLPATLFSLERTCLIVWGKNWAATTASMHTAHLAMESSVPPLPPKDDIGSAEDNLVISEKKKLSNPTAV